MITLEHVKDLISRNSFGFIRPARVFIPTSSWNRIHDSFSDLQKRTFSNEKQPNMGIQDIPVIADDDLPENKMRFDIDAASYHATADF